MQGGKRPGLTASDGCEYWFLGGQKKSPRLLTSQKAKAENLLPRYHFFWRDTPPPQPGQITRSPANAGAASGPTGTGDLSVGPATREPVHKARRLPLSTSRGSLGGPFFPATILRHRVWRFVVRYDTKCRAGLSRGMPEGVFLSPGSGGGFSNGGFSGMMEG